MDILKYIQDKAFKCEGCLLSRLNSRGENGPVLEGLRSDDDIRPCMALPPETEEEWRLGIRNCPGEELRLAMARALSSDMDLPWVPYAASEVLAMISTLPYTYSEYDEVKSMQNDVWGTCIAIIDYILLKRRYDAKKVGQEYNVDAMDICREMGQDYSREEFLRPLMPEAMYYALVGSTTPVGVGNEGSSTEMEDLPQEKKAIPHHNGGRHPVWTVKVDKDMFATFFDDGFGEFDTLVGQLENRAWSKTELCRLSALLLYSGYVKSFVEYRPWTVSMLESLGIPAGSRSPDSIDESRYAFYNLRKDLSKQKSIEFFRTNFNYLLGGEVGKEERAKFGIPDEPVG